MKSFLLALMILAFTSCTAQTRVKQDANGNFITVKDSTKAKSEGKPTGKTYTDTKGVVYPVFITSSGKYYINKVSKNTGNEYKQYLKVD